MKRSIYSAWISLKNKRLSNMDGLLLCEKTVRDIPIFLAAVCDGVGSTQDGAYAAAQTLIMLHKWFYVLEQTESLGLHFLSRMKKINTELSRQILNQDLKAATTFSAIFMTPDWYYLIHVGDSRIYGWKDRCLVQMTQDCVTSQGELCSYLGQEKSADFMYCEGRNEYQKYLLCTDGLYKRMDPEFLKEQMARVTKRNMKKIQKVLVNSVISGGEQDNITVAIIINEEGGQG